MEQIFFPQISAFKGYRVIKNLKFVLFLCNGLLYYARIPRFFESNMLQAVGQDFLTGGQNLLVAFLATNLSRVTFFVSYFSQNFTKNCLFCFFNVDLPQWEVIFLITIYNSGLTYADDTSTSVTGDTTEEVIIILANELHQVFFMVHMGT